MIPPVSVELVRRVTELGGKASNGLPLFRILRGCDRFTHIGGRWNKFDDSGNKTGEYIGIQSVLKYPEAKERYLLEVLCPAENYGSEFTWEVMFTEYIDGIKVETMGPFPREGEYELVRVIEREYKDSKGVTWKKEFVPLTSTICDAVVQTAIANKDLPERIRKEAKRKMWEDQQKEDAQKQEDKFLALEEKRPPWARNDSYVVLPSDADVSKFG